jgi:hypothetical protein
MNSMKLKIKVAPNYFILLTPKFIFSMARLLEANYELKTDVTSISSVSLEQKSRDQVFLVYGVAVSLHKLEFLVASTTENICCIGKQAEPHMNSTQRPLADLLKHEMQQKGEGADTKQLHTETDYIQHVLEDTMGNHIRSTCTVNKL